MWRAREGPRPWPTSVQVVLIPTTLILGLWLFSSGFLSVRTELPDTASCANQSADCSVKPAFQKAVVIVVDALREDFFFAGQPEDFTHAANDMPKLRQLVHNAGPAALAARFIADVPTITISRLKAWLTGCLPTFLDIGRSFSAVTLSEDNLLSQLAAQGKRTVFMGDDTWMQLAPKGVFVAAHPYPSFNVMDMHTVDDGVWKHLQQYLHEPGAWDVMIAHYLGVDHAGHAHGVGSAAMAAKLTQMDQQVVTVAEALVLEAGPGGAHEHTLLLVMSDHGQTQGGDHGGSSPDQVNTLLVAINLHAWWQNINNPPTTSASKRQPSTSTSKQHKPTAPGSPAAPAATDADATDQGDGLQGRGDGVANGVGEASGGRHAGQAEVVGDDDQRYVLPPRAAAAISISQLDLTATFALLMGIPVPYSNVGAVDSTLWHAMAGTARRTGSDDAQAACAEHADKARYLQALLLTCEQVHGYLQHYSRLSSLPAHHLHTTLQLYASTLSRAQRLASTTTQPAPATATQNASTHPSAARADDQPHTASSCEGDNPVAVAEAVAACRVFLSSAAALARRQFTGCNLPRMTAGCATMLLCIMLMLRMLHKHLPGANTGAAGKQRAVGGWRAAGGCWSGALHSPAVSMVSRTHVLGPLAACVFQSCSLFGLDWMMAEGRVMCACAAACITAMGAATAWQGLDSSSGLGTMHSGTTTTSTAGLATRPLAPTGPGPVVTRGRPRSLLVARAWAVAGPCLAACVGACSMVLLSQWGLMDRASSDPHDKAAQSTTLADLLGAPTPAHHLGSQGPAAGLQPDRDSTASPGTLPRLGDLLGVVVPLLALPWVTWVAYGWLKRMAALVDCHSVSHAMPTQHQLLASEQQSGTRDSPAAPALQASSRSSKRHVPGTAPSMGSGVMWYPAGTADAWLLSLTFGQYACCAVWWLLQLLGPGYPSATPMQSLRYLASSAAPVPPHTTTSQGVRETQQWHQGAASTQATGNPGAMTAEAAAPSSCPPHILAMMAVGVTIALLPVMAVMVCWLTTRQQAQQNSSSAPARWVKRVPAAAWVVVPLLGATIHACLFRPQLVAGLLDALLCDANAPSSSTCTGEQAGVVLHLLRQVLTVPYRLLLPRGVYALAALGVVQVLGASLMRRVMILIRLHGDQDVQVQDGLGGFWLASVLWPVVTLLLGRRGPTCMLLAALAVSSCVVLTALAARCCNCRTAGTQQVARDPQTLLPHDVGTSQTTGVGSAPKAAAVQRTHRSAALPGKGVAGGGSPLGASGPGAPMPISVSSGAQAAAACVREGMVLTAAGEVAAASCVGGALSLHALSGALFFATGHFCEFTGLQYASPFIGFDDMQWWVKARWISPALLTLNTFGAMLVGALPLALLPTVALAAALHSPPALMQHAGPHDMQSNGPPGQADAIQTAPALLSSPVSASRSYTSVPGSDDRDVMQTKLFVCESLAPPSQVLRQLHVLTLVTFACARCCTTCMLMLCSTVLHGHILVWAIIAPRVVFELFFQLVAAAVVLLICAVTI